MDYTPLTLSSLDSLKEKLTARKLIQQSTLTNPTSLWVPLYLYSKATWECYINYMEGFSILVNWIGEIDYPQLSTLDKKIEVPEIFRTYDLQEIGRILAKHSKKEVHYIEQCIYIAMTTQVIPKLAV